MWVRREALWLHQVGDRSRGVEGRKRVSVVRKEQKGGHVHVAKSHRHDAAAYCVEELAHQLSKSGPLRQLGEYTSLVVFIMYYVCYVEYVEYVEVT